MTIRTVAVLGAGTMGHGIAHAAMTALAAAAATEGGDLADRLAAGSFTTAVGPLSFGADHELRDNPYRLLVWRAGAFVPAEDRAE